MRTKWIVLKLFILKLIVIALNTNSSTIYMEGTTIKTQKIMWATWIVLKFFFKSIGIVLNTNSSTSYMVGSAIETHTKIMWNTNLTTSYIVVSIIETQKLFEQHGNVIF